MVMIYKFLCLVCSESSGKPKLCVGQKKFHSELAIKLVFVKHNIFHSKHLVFVKLSNMTFSISKLGVRQNDTFSNSEHVT